MPIAEKMICHCSGSLSSRIFSGIENAGAFGFSVHPLLAVSDRYESYQELPKALITIEGEKAHLPKLKSFLESTGLTVCEIDSEAKVRYHGAAVFASNLVVGLLSAASDEFAKCGLPEEHLGMAMESLVLGNVKKVLAVGGSDALTGPVERNDVGTVKKHLDEFDGINKEIYKVLSRKAMAIAEAKHPDYDYMQLEEVLNT